MLFLGNAKIVPLILLALLSCKQTQKFNKTLWRTQDDFEWPYRESMLDDLIKNHQLVNLKYKKIIELLGPSNYGDSSSVSYEIITDYGRDIDPVYTKTLRLKLNGDSIVTSFKVVEWGER